MANPFRTVWSIAATAAFLLASGGPPAAASSGGTTAPGGDVLAPPTANGLVPAGGAPATMPLKPDTLLPPAGGALLGEVTTVHGQLTLRNANHPVVLEYFDPAHGWQVVAKGTTNPIGAFALPLRPRHIGRFMFRATTPQSATAATTAAMPTTPIEVYRPVVATIFGAGDYGSRTACGETLTPSLLGVAHLTLPCGTPVDITYGARAITVAVVDRGPFVGGITYDLTAATATALGIDETARIGALAIHGAPPPGH